ncbi:MAG: YibE/F family protein [Microgenomates group bacterium]
MAIKLKIFILSFLLFIISTNAVNAQAVTFEGEVTKIIQEEGDYQKLEVTSNQKQEIIENGLFDTSFNIKYKVGDKVVITDGMITDYVRRPSLFLLLAIFLILAITIAGKWGLTSIVGMAYSFYVIFVFILPMILKGYDAVVVAIIGSMFIIPVTFGLSHGINRKTINAVIGTIVSMIIVGLLSVLFVDLAKLTGFAVEEAGFLQYQLGGVINMKGILLAGIIISTLGVMDDITVSQASVVEELKKANSKLSKKDLFLRSMNVGKDHISSMVNTLVLVYAGASLPLLLLFVNNPHPFSEVINYEIIADEIVRTMVGSIGLILAVPITTYIAVQNISKTSKAR